MTPSLLDTAMKYYALGIATIPIKFKDKLPDSKAIKKVTGDYSWKRYMHTCGRLPTPEELVTWFANGADRNIAVMSGWSGLTIIDFDDDHRYQKWIAWIRDEDNLIARYISDNTYQVITGRGRHIYVLLEDPLDHNIKGAVEIQATRRYNLAPPSVHPTGKIYQAVNPDAVILTVDRIERIMPRDWLFPPKGISVRGVVMVRPPTLSPAEMGDPWESASDPQPGLEMGIVKKIKATIDIRTFLPPDAHPSGNGYLVAYCPLHDDEHRSLLVDLDRQKVKCMAGCTQYSNRGAWIDVINLYARLRKITNGDAVRELAKLI